MKYTVLAVAAVATLSAQAADPSDSTCGPPEESTLFLINPQPGEHGPSSEEVAESSTIARGALVRQLSNGLRTSPESEYSALRRMLSERHIDPLTSALVELIPVSERHYMAVVVTAGREVFTFDTDFVEQSEWQRLTDSWRSTPYCRSIDDGIRFLAGDA